MLIDQIIHKSIDRKQVYSSKKYYGIEERLTTIETTFEDIQDLYSSCEQILSQFKTFRNLYEKQYIIVIVIHIVDIQKSLPRNLFLLFSSSWSRAISFTGIPWWSFLKNWLVTLSSNCLFLCVLTIIWKYFFIPCNALVS